MSANVKHLLLALFLCVGMIGLSGSGIGPTCAAKAQNECGCCPMQPEETCCSAGDEPLQAIQFARPGLFMLPAVASAEVPQPTCSPSLSSAGPSVQALLCLRTVWAWLAARIVP